jgi:hypothetical protein
LFALNVHLQCFEIITCTHLFLTKKDKVICSAARVTLSNAKAGDFVECKGGAFDYVKAVQFALLQLYKRQPDGKQRICEQTKKRGKLSLDELINKLAKS